MHIAQYMRRQRQTLKMQASFWLHCPQCGFRLPPRALSALSDGETVAGVGPADLRVPSRGIKNGRA
jgi:hypothetical protein